MPAYKFNKNHTIESQTVNDHNNADHYANSNESNGAQIRL